RGLRGLLVQARRDGDRVEALALARRAFALRPDTPWVGHELFSLEAAAGDWQAAEKTLTHTIKRKLMPMDESARHQAIVLFAQAQDADAMGESKRALDLARKAHSQLPDFSPAAALAGRLHGAAGEARKARRLLQTAWRTSPHPDLLAAWLEMHPTDEPEDRLDAVQKLVAEMADDPESRRAVARAALEAGEYDQARVQLKALMEQAPSANAARLIADLEEAERGDGAAARQWLRQAASLPVDATWVCQDCGRQNGAWAAHCPDCGSFDAFVWRIPPGAGAVLPYAAGEVDEPDEAEEIVEMEILPPDVEPAPTTPN
ncbi:MAG: tetratricopeptide repeat protein, partial [Rhodospirillaceae bacterium]|nr:tetratricopeptide repeat protein [Rhodospirillaceae bacterium]